MSEDATKKAVVNKTEGEKAKIADTKKENECKKKVSEDAEIKETESPKQNTNCKKRR